MAGVFRPTPVFREARRQRLARVTLRDGHAREVQAMVRDVSSRGFSALAQGHVPDPDEVVSVCLPDGTELWGVVRWVDGNRFGVEFDTSSAR